MGVAFVKVSAYTAAEVCARVPLPGTAMQFLRSGATPRDFLEALLANNQYTAAIDFIAHALPPREAVWWGCLCFQHACGETMSPAEKIACKAAVVWVMRPCEETRALAKAPAELAGRSSPAGALATAANQTGGSIAPPNYPPIPPEPTAPSRAVATAVKIAAIKAQPPRKADHQRAYIELAMKIAEGQYV